MTRGFAQNVKAREAVSELLDCVPAIIEGCNEDRFWELLAVAAADRCGKIVEDPQSGREPFTDTQAEKFEKENVPYGVFKGVPVGQVDPEYWSGVFQGEFSTKLRRYIRSRYFRKKHGLPV